MFEWREVAALAKFEFLLEIAGEIVMARELNRRTERRVSLYENFSGGFATPGAPCNLCEKLKRPFACAKIGEMQCKIGIDDSDERDVRKMQTFRDHLGSHQNVDLAGAKIS